MCDICWNYISIFKVDCLYVHTFFCQVVNINVMAVQGINLIITLYLSVDAWLMVLVSVMNMAAFE